MAWPAPSGYATLGRMVARIFRLSSVLGLLLMLLILWLAGCSSGDAGATPTAPAGDPAPVSRLPRAAPPLPQTQVVDETPASPEIAPTASGVSRDATPLPTVPLSTVQRITATPVTVDPVTPTTATFTLTPTLPAGATEPASADLVLLPTPTPTPAQATLPTPTATARATALAAIAASEGTSPAAPGSYRARGAFDSTTTFPDGTVQQQQGEFEITRIAADHPYGADESYRLVTTGPSGEADTVEVYQIGEYIAARFAEGEWVVTERSQGSGLVKAIQPITELATAFLRIQSQAELIGVEEIGGAPTRHYRIDDPARFAELFARSPVQGAGMVTALRFDAWVAEQGYVLQYDFRLEVAGARVLDEQFQEVAADQVVTWSYELLEVSGDLALRWPEDAPLPGMIEAPGFAPGEFPIPPESEVVSTYVGVPELVSARPLEEVSRFYEEQLAALGWTVEGAYGLYRCSKDGASFQLLITEEEATGGSRVSILSDE